MVLVGGLINTLASFDYDSYSVAYQTQLDVVKD